MRPPDADKPVTHTTFWFDVVGLGWSTCGFESEYLARAYKRETAATDIVRVERTTTEKRTTLPHA